MKQIVLGTFLALFLLGCNAKKRSTSSKKKEKDKVAYTKSPDFKDSETYPMPSDDGKFATYRINSVEEYIDTFSEIAKAEMIDYGIPASITLAQGILESGFGQSELVLKTNNHFGIKCHNGWDGAFAYHDDDSKGECFRKYNHPMYSFRDHSIFLSSRSRYSTLFDLRKDNYKGWAKGLKKAGYATDPRYPQKLISFIERYDLNRFDREVIRNGVAVKRPPRKFDLTTYKVQQGDTLYSISRRYYISVEEIMKLNKLNDSTISIGQKLVIKSEKTK
ncbi:MAG: glucosaminidase domain-containing protein [Flavobacteriaceae bacterium]